MLTIVLRDKILIISWPHLPKVCVIETQFLQISLNIACRQLERELILRFFSRANCMLLLWIGNRGGIADTARNRRLRHPQAGMKLGT